MTVPVLRFWHDDGTEYPAWEENTLGDLSICLEGTALPKADISESDRPFIHYEEHYTTY